MNFTLYSSIQRPERINFRMPLMASMLLFSLFAATNLLGQSSYSASDFGDIKSVVWKPTAELTTVIDAEKSRMAYELSNNSLVDSDRALFLAFDQLLGLVKTDAQTGAAIDESIVRNFDIVIHNSQKTKVPDMTALNPDAFLPLALTLVESLQNRETPVLNPKF